MKRPSMPGPALAALLLAGCASAAGPTPSAERPSSAPVAATASRLVAATAAPDAGDLRTYVVDRPFPVRVTFALGDGWSSIGTAADACCAIYLKHEARPPGLLLLGFWIVDDIYEDPCQHIALDPPVGPTVGELADALAKLPVYGAAAPTDITLDGFAGRRVVLTIPDSIDVTGCVGQEFVLWSHGGDGTRYVPPGYDGGEDQVMVLDVRGVRLVIEAAFSLDASAVDRAELVRILGSIRIG